MNTKLSSIAIALIATTASAYASDLTGSPRTRAEVRAELEQAYAQGQVGQAREWVEFNQAASGKSREQVLTELTEAQAQPKPRINTGEYVEPAPVTSTRSRAEVRAEVEQAYAQGELNHNDEVVNFTNLASTRTRDAVREEAIRAARASRQRGDHSGS
ncbi:MAG TPA: DUF4148 domain-containing protein [Noviherbaspirillum sp.]|uniref:DUF4148 domain-containing protein n=1 Tax=Noviherbaspirillum sp. TaxID=1926288 RepID=UPI002B4686C1|nr:DUF4148 domain-containing protein [Noviherbaspirillum sp.]HJV83917.1 DUF4148 domain-containing protein [Noviherbaspirillum sp.]